ncbi:Bromodomain-containing protein, partial [Dendrothele bispora CBS 962.96]
FLHPVDPNQVPGYADVVKHPMDFGTITNKVNRGRYRSLEEFANDFRLVVSNAKLFNPPGTIYHTEADRIDAWGSDHIAKAASTVIQYETDWNIEIDGDGDDNVNIEEDVDMSVGVSNAMDVDVAGSVASSAQPSAGPSRRSTRGPYKKVETATSSKISESIDADGRLPGSKDGLGAFPPGSDWAKTMLDLKLKGVQFNFSCNLSTKLFPRQEIQDQEREITS